MKMKAVTAALIAVLVLVFIRMWSLPGLLVDYWWYESVALDSIFLLNLKAHLGFFFGAAAVSGLMFYINWKSAKKYLKKMEVSDEIIDSLSGLYAFVSIGVIALMAATFSGHYFMFMEFLNQVPFGVLDPVFGNDVGFYIFTLPVIYKLLNFVLFNCLVLLVANVLLWLFSNRLDTVAEDKDIPLIPRILVAGLLAVLGIRFYLDKFSYLTYTADSTYLTGAGKNDLTIFPFWLTLAAVLIVALGILVLIGRPRGKDSSVMIRYSSVVIAFMVFAGVIGVLIPSVWSYVYYEAYVHSSEQQEQALYINNSIEYTRAAYKLDMIEERNYSNNVVLNSSVIDSPSVANARIFDLEPWRQFLQRDQAIARNYRFIDPDVDRYIIDGQEEQVIVSARELNPEQIPVSWENKRTIYTMGHGAVIGSVNKAGNDRMPKLYLKNIPSTTSYPEFELEEEGIRYGEGSNEYIFTNTKRLELDYPHDNENVYTVYDGTGGIPVGGWWKKLVIAWECGDTVKIMTSDYITPESRLHLNRNIGIEVAKIVPYLYLDPDNSLFVNQEQKNLKWMISGVAYTNGYPYSSVAMLGDHEVNYVSDAAKTVVDAANGSMEFYVVNKDPMMLTYMNIYPGLFKDIEEMPDAERSHMKYSEQLFNVQTGELLTFHMTKLETYFTKQDQWKLANEISDSGESEVAVPYNMVLDTGNGTTAFVLVRTFNPADPKMTNMVSWISVNQDWPDYGKMELIKFETGKTISGPAQIDAYIDQDPEFSQKLSLWGRQGSTVIRGNTLILLVNDGILNIKPIYIASSSESNSIPQLAAVLVYYEDPITGKTYLRWGSTVKEATDQIFGKSSTPIDTDGVEQELSSNPLIMKILIMDSDGNIVNTIPVQSDQSFMVQPVATVAAVNNTAVTA